MMLKKIVSLLILLLIAGSFVFAGGNKESAPEPEREVVETVESSAEKDTAVEETESGGGIYPVTIEDDSGQNGGEAKVLVLEKPVEKVVVAEKGCALVLKEFGVLDKVAAASQWIIMDLPGYENIPSIGGMNVDLEMIIGLGPDVYINLVGHNDKTDKQLTDAGIGIYTVGTVRDLDHIKEHTKEYGLMFDKVEIADRIIADMEAKEAQAAELVKKAGLSEAERPTVFMFGPIGDKETLQTWAPSGETIVEDLIVKGGGRCLTAEQGLTGWPQYSLETLLESDPDVIILPLGEGLFESAEEFKSLEITKDLSAVQNDRVYGIEKSLVFDLSFKNATALIQFAEFINR
jgi:ABC-type Fe3+-hydroxamate transport system substrate-binding protein